MPFIQEIFEDTEWSSKRLVILAINLSESPSQAEEFRASYVLSFPVLLDTKGKVAKEYNVRSIPETLFIDKNGIIQDVKIGAFSGKDEIEMKLSRIVP